MDLPHGRTEVQSYWQKHFAKLALQGLVPVQHNPLRGDVFLDLNIEGSRFQGVAVKEFGPFIGVRSPLGGDCALGVASINCCTDRHTESWQVCKYHNQHRIDLSDLSHAGRRTLAWHFGLPWVPMDPLITLIPTEWAFYVSPAFDALHDWAQKHPRLMKTSKPNAYLWDWPRAALSGDSGQAIVCAE